MTPEELKDLKCGPKPCGNCKDSYRLMTCQDTCMHYTSWLDQQLGYAKGLAEAESKVAREIAQLRILLATLCNLAPKAVEYGDWPELQQAIEDAWEYLEEKGIDVARR